MIFKDHVLVINANFPWGARKILQRIKVTTNKPIRYVFDTHYDSDHAYGNSIFFDAGALIARKLVPKNCARKGLAGGPIGATKRILSRVHDWNFPC